MTDFFLEHQRDCFLWRTVGLQQHLLSGYLFTAGAPFASSLQSGTQDKYFLQMKPALPQLVSHSLAVHSLSPKIQASKFILDVNNATPEVFSSLLPCVCVYLGALAGRKSAPCYFKGKTPLPRKLAALPAALFQRGTCTHTLAFPGRPSSVCGQKLASLQLALQKYEYMFGPVNKFLYLSIWLYHFNMAYVCEGRTRKMYIEYTNIISLY